MPHNPDHWLQFDRVNTILYCRNWRETVTFYRDLLQLPVAFENDWFVEFRLSADAYLSIADTRRASIRAVHGQGVTLTLRVSDIDTVLAGLQENEIQVTPIKRKWDALVLYCHDPEGHRLEFWQDLAN